MIADQRKGGLATETPEQTGNLNDKGRRPAYDSSCKKAH